MRSLFLQTLGLVFLLTFSYVCNAAKFTVNGSNYSTISNNTVSIIYSPIQNGVVDIPETVQYNGSTYTVTEIAENFASYEKYANGLKVVKFPKTITKVGKNAFNGCNIEKVYISDIRKWCAIDFVNLGSSPFCRNETTQLYVDDVLCKSLVIPDDVEVIKKYAFSYLYLYSVTVGVLVKDIQEPQTFAKAAKLIFRPNNIALFDSGKNFYGGNYGVIYRSFTLPGESLTVQEERKHTYFKYSLLSSAFTVDGVTYVPNTDGKTCDVIDCDYNNCPEKVTIPATVSMPLAGGKSYRTYSVININKNAFYKNDRIKILEVRNEGYVGDSAFYNCASIEKMKVLNKSDIHQFAFSKITSLDEVLLDNDGYVGENSFADDKIRTSVDITSRGDVLPQTFINSQGNYRLYVNNTGTIQTKAFFNNGEMRVANVGDNVTEIWDSAFEYCTNLNPLYLGAGLKLIGSSAFRLCESLENLDIPNNVKTVRDKAFQSCLSMSKLNIGRGLNRIEDCTFESCTSLLWLKIPKEINKIYTGAFSNCTSLTGLELEDKESSYRFGPGTRKQPMFYHSPLDSIYIGGPIELGTDDALTPNTSLYNESPFRHNETLRAVKFSDFERKIYTKEFQRCINLKNVWMGKGIMLVDDYAFESCQSLKYINIGPSVGPLGEYSFAHCPSLEKVNASTVTSIGEAAFDICTSLKIINMSEMRRIGGHAFNKCTALPAIYIPGTIEDIGHDSFNECTSLKLFSIAEAEDTVGIGAQNELNGLLNDCPLDSAYIGKNIVYTGLEDVSPFYNHPTIQTLELGKDVTYAPSHLVWRCLKLGKLLMGDKVTHVKTHAVQLCPSLETIVLGTGLKMLHDNAFSDCSNLTSIYCKATTPPDCEDQALQDVRVETCAVYVPIGSENRYSQASGWDAFYCEGVRFNTEDPATLTVEKITLSSDNMTVLNVGDTELFTYSWEPGGFDPNAQWESSNPTVAIVSKSNGNQGSITAKAPGTAVIKVSAPNGVYDSCTVTVKQRASSISLSETSIKMDAGEFKTLTANISPSTTDDKSISWSSSNTGVANVNSSGVVEALGEGTAVITATTENGKQADCTIIVSQNVKSVSLNTSAESIWVGGTYTLLPDVKPDNSTDKNLSWTSSNSSVAVVNGGVVSGISCGTATITCTSLANGSASATCVITVKQKVEEISFNTNVLCMTAGETFSLRASISPLDATNPEISWRSSNASVATVSSTGLVTARGQGSATIYAEAKDGSNTVESCYVDVVDDTGNILASGTCGDGPVWRLYEDGILKVSGAGVMFYEEKYGWTVPWIDFKNNIKRVEIGDEITSVGMIGALPNLTSFTLGSKVTEIQDACFSDLPKLTQINIPASVTRIGYFCFSNCENLCYITVDSRNNVYDSRNDCNAIIDKSSNKLITGCMSTIIPYGVTCIQDGAFNGHKKLKSISIPTSVKRIEDDAFTNTGLTEFVVPSGVEYVGNAIQECPDLQRIVIGDDVTQCWMLTSNIYLPNLQSISFGKSLINIDWVYMSIPASVTELKIASGNPKYDTRDNCNCIIETESNTLIRTCSGSVIPSTIEDIEPGAFVGYPHPILIIPEGITSLPEDAFLMCKNLQYIVLPSTITYIHPRCFEYCSNLVRIDCRAITPPDVSRLYYGSNYYGFDDDTWLNHVNCNVYVPYTSIESYKTSESWQGFADISYLEIYAQNLAIDESEPTVVAGESISLRAESDGEYVEKITWSSSDEQTAMVDDGLVTGVMPGTAVITASIDNPLHPKANSTIEVLARGDVDGSGSIDNADIAGGLKFILDDEDTEGLYWDAADYNDNEIINVTDITSIVRMALTGKTSLKARKKVRGVQTESTVLQIQTSPAASDNTQELSIGLDSEDIFTTLQFDILLPDNVDLEEVMLGSNVADHNVVTHRHEEGFIRVICYSMNNMLFSNSQGDILRIRLKPTDSQEPQTCHVDFKNIKLVRTDITSVYCERQRANIFCGETTNIYRNDSKTGNISVHYSGGILMLTTDEDTQVCIFDSNGRVIHRQTMKAGKREYLNIPSGMYIINNQKVILN